jgi:hypothetical protein
MDPKVVNSLTPGNPKMMSNRGNYLPKMPRKRNTLQTILCHSWGLFSEDICFKCDRTMVKFSRLKSELLNLDKCCTSEPITHNSAGRNSIIMSTIWYYSWIYCLGCAWNWLIELFDEIPDDAIPELFHINRYRYRHLLSIGDPLVSRAAVAALNPWRLFKEEEKTMMTILPSLSTRMFDSCAPKCN